MSKLFISLDNYHGQMLYLVIYIQSHVNPCFSILFFFFTKNIDILSETRKEITSLKSQFCWQVQKIDKKA